jgi:hypothetical protein
MEQTSVYFIYLVGLGILKYSSSNWPASQQSSKSVVKTCKYVHVLYFESVHSKKVSKYLINILSFKLGNGLAILKWDLYLHKFICEYVGSVPEALFPSACGNMNPLGLGTLKLYKHVGRGSYTLGM